MHISNSKHQTILLILYTFKRLYCIMLYEIVIFLEKRYAVLRGKELIKFCFHI